MDIIGIGGLSATSNLMVRTETKIGNKTGNRTAKGNCGEYLLGYVSVMHRIRNSLELADLMLCYT